MVLEILLNPIEVLFLCLFIQGPQGRSGLPGLPGADGPPVSISDTAKLLIDDVMIETYFTARCL